MTKILVIEDEVILREEVSEWLRLEGYEPISAADGVEGVNLAIRHLPDLIMCDIAMPRLNGYDVMFDLRANSETQLIPFIYMTARASREDIRQGMALGADDYITKPFTREEVLQAVQSCLQKRALQEKHQQREVEQWRQALKQEHEKHILNTKVFAMFSHDFRNPLTSIITSNSLLRDYSHKMDEQRRLTHFNRVESSANQLIQMLNDMLVIAQLETGSLGFEPEQLNITEFVNQIVKEFQLQCSETHSVVFNINYIYQGMVDPRLLRQITANLLSNAIKYSPQGSEICVSLQRANQRLELTVQDHGIGIPEVDQHRLFNAFQRASNVGSVSGTGLGLAIVQQAVDIHGGTIQLDSQVGVGTTITVRLPV